LPRSGHHRLPRGSRNPRIIPGLVGCNRREIMPASTRVRPHESSSLEVVRFAARDRGNPRARHGDGRGDRRRGCDAGTVLCQRGVQRRAQLPARTAGRSWPRRNRAGARGRPGCDASCRRRLGVLRPHLPRPRRRDLARHHAAGLERAR
jgi:hypothetical protein